MVASPGRKCATVTGAIDDSKDAALLVQWNDSPALFTSLDPLPSTIAVVAAPRHSTIWSGPASANGPPIHSDDEVASLKLRSWKSFSVLSNAPVPTRSRWPPSKPWCCQRRYVTPCGRQKKADEGASPNSSALS